MDVSKNMSKIIGCVRLVAQHDLYKEQSHCLRQSGRGLQKHSGITLIRSELPKHFILEYLKRDGF